MAQLKFRIIKEHSFFHKHTAKIFLFTTVVISLLFLSTISGIWIEETNGNYLAGYIDGQVDALNGQISIVFDTTKTATMKTRIRPEEMKLYFAPKRGTK